MAIERKSSTRKKKKGEIFGLSHDFRYLISRPLACKIASFFFSFHFGESTHRSAKFCSAGDSVVLE